MMRACVGSFMITLRLFTRVPSLSTSQFNKYLADFPRIEATEASSFESCITEEKIWKVLKKFRKDWALMVCSMKHI